MPVRTEKIWNVLSPKEDIEKELCGSLNIEPLIAKILINRGISSAEEADKFINMSLEDLHPPMLVDGMKEAVDRICDAVAGREKIIICGDYDVDGMSATSLLVGFFRDTGLEVFYYIPHRINEGYGLNESIIRKIAADKYNLIITVDCGVTSFHEVAIAKELGVDVIITDHHQVSETLPPAIAVLNPTKEGCGYPFKHLAGVGIAFKLITALRTAMVEGGIITKKDAPNLRRCLDLVALGTLADMVPLTGENRVIVRFGLEEISKTKKTGLRAMKNLGNFGSRPMGAADVGFYFAPRLNAIGRLQSARKGVELLTTDDRFKAKEIARLLDAENSKRQAIQRKIFREVLDRIEKEVDVENDRAIILASEGWHPGVIGIVAAKVVERFYLPTVLMNMENGICRGSARSIPTFHIYNGLRMCKDTLLYFGGHKYAAGLSLESGMVAAFKKEFQRAVKEQFAGKVHNPVLDIDAVVPLAMLSHDVVEEIADLGPFGTANQYPLMLSKGVRFASEPIFVGKDKEHVTFEVEADGCHADGIAFGMARQFRDTDITNGRFDIVYAPALMSRGKISRTFQIRLRDFKRSVKNK
ncbi:MAG: single-stranded-DNA-specific exonuclease RecJ [bacterium]|nr:MAG: single-stranded-DNA-specific exonuclease RecJ [bacterium]